MAYTTRKLNEIQITRDTWSVKIFLSSDLKKHSQFVLLDYFYTKQKKLNQPGNPLCKDFFSCGSHSHDVQLLQKRAMNIPVQGDNG